MKFWLSIFVFGVAHLLILCDANKHSFGNNHFGTRLAYEKTLINDNNKVPKNYTIIYKCLGVTITSISYLEFDVNVESEGTVSSFFNRDSKIEAKIHINSALNVTATIRIYKLEIYDLPIFNEPGESSEMESITYIHKKNADASKKKPFAQNAIGRRRDGDSLLHFESRNITNGSRFPSRAFEYSGPDYITYVGFSFNSPTAMAMINTSFIGEQEFNAVAYDMNTEHFVANISVYGIKSEGIRPHEFEGVIGVGVIQKSMNQDWMNLFGTNTRKNAMVSRGFDSMALI